MKVLRLLWVVLLASSTLLWLPPALADTPSLQVAPLQYVGTLTPGRVSDGFVDVSNPTDAPVLITSSVKAFRQTNSNGDLQFYNDPSLSAGIKVDLTSFTLGPREAVRVVFSVDPSKLPGGGVYGAIFFRTQPPNQSSGSSYVVQSANIGTLLILTNGGPNAHRGAITNLQLPMWQFGASLHGTLSYQNTDQTRAAVAFTPRLSTSILPWGHATALQTGLVLPSSTRQFDFNRPGSYFGLLSLTVSDADTNAHRTAWVFALTGTYRWAMPLLMILVITTTILLWHRWPRLQRN